MRICAVSDGRLPRLLPPPAFAFGSGFGGMAIGAKGLQIGQIITSAACGVDNVVSLQVFRQANPSALTAGVAIAQQNLLTQPPPRPAAAPFSPVLHFGRRLNAGRRRSSNAATKCFEFRHDFYPCKTAAMFRALRRLVKLLMV